MSIFKKSPKVEKPEKTIEAKVEEKSDSDLSIEAKEETKKEPQTLKSYFKTKKGRTKFLTRVGMFGALSGVFYAWLKFSLPMFPSFLEVNFSNIFVIIGSLSVGPVGGIIIVIVKMILKIILVGTSTNYVGELTDLLLSILIMLPASLVYMKKRTKIGGFVGILLSFISWIVFSVLINWGISMPFYLKFYFNGDVTSLVSLLSVTIPGVNETNFMSYYLFLAILPFNALVAFVNCGLAFLVYKKISVFLKKIGI